MKLSEKERLVYKRYVANLRDEASKAEAKLEYAKLSPKKRKEYDAFIKQEMEDDSWALTQRVDLETAKKEAKNEQAIATAVMMKNEGEPIEKIMKYTGLDKVFIKALDADK